MNGITTHRGPANLVGNEASLASRAVERSGTVPAPKSLFSGFFKKIFQGFRALYRFSVRISRDPAKGFQKAISQAAPLLSRDSKVPLTRKEEKKLFQCLEKMFASFQKMQKAHQWSPASSRVRKAELLGEKVQVSLQEVVDDIAVFGRDFRRNSQRVRTIIKSQIQQKLFFQMRHGNGAKSNRAIESRKDFMFFNDLFSTILNVTGEVDVWGRNHADDGSYDSFPNSFDDDSQDDIVDMEAIYPSPESNITSQIQEDYFDPQNHSVEKRYDLSLTQPRIEEKIKLHENYFNSENDHVEVRNLPA